MLPLILGLIGLLWQAFAGKRGIEQFWVVFFLFFMTGIAIVLYLNQPPVSRESVITHLRVRSMPMLYG